MVVPVYHRFDDSLYLEHASTSSTKALVSPGQTLIDEERVSIPDLTYMVLTQDSRTEKTFVGCICQPANCPDQHATHSKLCALRLGHSLACLAKEKVK